MTAATYRPSPAPAGCPCASGAPVAWCDEHSTASAGYTAGLAAAAARLETAAGRTADPRTAAWALDVARGLRALARV